MIFTIYLVNCIFKHFLIIISAFKLESDFFILIKEHVLFKKLESLRGIAACMVILYHSPFNFGLQPLGIFNNSYLFVDFFFILSGFVMTFAYGEKILEGFPFYKYISLRLGRIYPLHLFILLAWVPYVLIKQYLYSTGYGGTDQIDTSNIYTFISNLFLVHSMGIHSNLSWNYPSWSISTEFFAYLTFFIITFSIDKKNSLIIPLIISAISYVFIFNTSYSNLDITYNFGFIRCLGAFYIGVFLFRVRPKIKLINSEKLIQFLEVFSILLLIIFVTFSESNKPILFLTIISFSLLILIYTSDKNGVLGKFLESSIMREIGVRSYSIYMLLGLFWAVIMNIFMHVLYINPETTFGFTSIIINAVVILSIILISKYTYIYIEKYFRDLVKIKFKE